MKTAKEVWVLADKKGPLYVEARRTRHFAAVLKQGCGRYSLTKYVLPSVLDQVEKLVTREIAAWRSAKGLVGPQGPGRLAAYKHCLNFIKDSRRSAK